MRAIIVHQEYGILVGISMGLVFWSNLEDAGQSEVATFDSQMDAIDFVNTYLKLQPGEYSTYQVDDGKVETLHNLGFDIGLLIKQLPENKGRVIQPQGRIANSIQ